ncbi:MAG: recombinase family protein [Gammaproteobacteria bacterium]|nr:recombinase family protein [Gammaproteobacteria bacterium]
MSRHDSTQKITPEHLARKALVYLRQSSLAQVKQNQESQRLQYALTDTAETYGFKRVEVIDCDLGMSAATGAQAREGFKRVLASVAMGEVGMVLSRELSRLSRTDKDWCQLMELCQVFNTLIADAENLYDLNRLDDQLVLGIKGTLSVVELKTLKFRLQQGREAKAKRGELGWRLAPGYITDPVGQIVKDPSLRVQEAIALVFRKFAELGSIRQSHRWFHEETIELPVNKSGQFQLVWQLPTVSFINDVLHNPLYAGAYVYGRRPTEVVVKHGQALRRQRSVLLAEDASVFIPDHHPSYISWAQYQRNQDIMRSNGGNFTQDESALAVRSGQGLLTGLLRCARCGRKLHIRYWGKSGTAARYVCAGEFATGGQYCLGFGGATVDKRLSEEILKVISPRGLNASIAAIERLSNQDSDRRAALERQLQQLQYESQRAFDQYNQADPANRLVADVLEQRWNDKLEALERLQGELDAHSEASAPLSPAETEATLALGNDFAAVWNDPACPMVLRKKIARTLINEIVIDLDEAAQALQMIIHWHGGCHTSLTLPKPRSGAVAHKTTLEDLELITKMARRYRDDEIARVLSKLGRRTGKGNRWTQSRVAYVRKKYTIATPELDKLDPDILTLGQATKYCSVSDTTLIRLIKEDILAVEQVAPYAPLEIQRADLDGEPVSSILQRLKATGKLSFDGNTLANQRSLFDENQ